MSVGEVVAVNKDGAVIALRKLGLNLQRREEMYSAMGAAMLVSIRLTFREQGSPEGSWVPLSPNTVARDPKKYGSGHKLLIDKGILLNSITFAVTSSGVSVGTNLVYAAVQNFGSRDLVGPAVGIGPSNRNSSHAVAVAAHVAQREREIHYQRVEITRADGSKVMVPRALRTGKALVVGKDGKTRTVNKLFAGPRQQVGVDISAHTRHQNIPARPYMVFRPEDPARLQRIAVGFVNKAKADAGLAGG